MSKDFRENYPARGDGKKDANGFWLADTIADLTVEPAITPGTEVEVPCDICNGNPDYSKTSFKNEDCWRCDGTGKAKCMSPQKNCPGCNADLIGGQISLKHMSAYGSTHFGRAIGISCNDYTQAYKCPDCGAEWSRWNGRVLEEGESVAMLHYEAEGKRYVTGTGQAIGVHAQNDECDISCVIHNPSDHSMKNWPTHYNWDEHQMERVNPQTKEHVRDPDDQAFEDRRKQKARNEENEYWALRKD